jgi:glycosyltransferase involved in cell wall biosynthesis
MRIVLFIASLQDGGAERVISILANGFHRRGHQVSLVHLGGASPPPFYPIDPGVQVIPTGLNRISPSLLHGMAANLGRIRRLRSLFRELQPEVVLSFMDTANVLAVMATRGLRIPTLVSERVDPRGNPLPAFWRGLRLLAYTLCEGLVTQSSGARAFFPPWIRCKTVTLPNPILTPGPPATDAPARDPGLVAIAMGRLDPAKGFDVLLQAFALVLQTCPAWSLHIIGEGLERSRLEALAGRLGIQDKLQLPGRIQEPHPRLCQADLFILSSRVEGFPNALCEAMACGLPVIATECTDSIRTILEDGQAGQIVPPEDPVALAQAMVALMQDPERRKDMGERARRSVSRFQGNTVIEAWERLLEGACAERAGVRTPFRTNEEP